jgi:SAM-dependent methyltransferase
MSGAEREVADMFAAIRQADPSESNDQFLSLTAANQYRLLYELTARYVPPGSQVLDWGCGRGHFSYFLVKRGYEVTAYSLEHPPEIFAALSGAESLRLTFVRGDLAAASRLPFADGRFAAAFSVGVLEHVRELGGDERSSLRELRRVLSDEGLFLCYHLPNRYSYIEALSRRLGTRRAASFHRFRFTARDIHALCRETRLSVVECGRYGFLPRNSANRLPARLRRSTRLAAAVNRSDALLERLFAPVVQNHYFVARRAPDETPPPAESRPI